VYILNAFGQLDCSRRYVPVTKQYNLVAICDWEGNRRSDVGAVALAVHYLYGLKAYGTGCEHSTAIRSSMECGILLLFSTRNFPMIRVVVAVGTTLFECKTGYGLTAEAELKMLRVMENSRHRITADVSVTYCAAHAVPE